MPNNEGKAYIAPWIIKLLAGALLVSAFAWAGTVTDKNAVQDVQIKETSTEVKDMTKQLDRIEGKLDRLRR